MKRVKFFSISVCTCLLLQATAALGGWFGADFSAEVVEGTAQGKAVRGKMYVGAGRVRTEMGQSEQRLIEIINPKLGRAWLIDSGSRRYRERSVPMLTAEGSENRNPCSAVAGAECRQLPDEAVQGRPAHKWLLRLGTKERLQWNDAEHGFPLQVVESGRLVMSMRFLGVETLQGRRVERWRALQQSGDARIESEQWYDPQLNIAIRQVAQDGSFRELHNIQLGSQAEALFELPQGYQRLDGAAR